MCLWSREVTQFISFVAAAPINVGPDLFLMPLLHCLCLFWFFPKSFCFLANISPETLHTDSFGSVKKYVHRINASAKHSIAPSSSLLFSLGQEKFGRSDTKWNSIQSVSFSFILKVFVKATIGHQPQYPQSSWRLPSSSLSFLVYYQACFPFLYFLLLWKTRKKKDVWSNCRFYWM